MGRAGIPMPETYTQVHVFCGLVGHYRRFIKGFANIVHPLYDVLGKEVKMGLVDLPPKAREAMGIVKGKVQSTPVLVFPDFDKPFLLETDASKEGLGAVLSQKQSDGRYHPVAFGSRSLTSHSHSHSQQTVQSLLEGAIVGASDRGEAEANEGLLEEHERLSREAQVQAAKLELMHVVDWEQAQEADVALAGCRKWLCLRKGMPPPRQDTLLRECLGAEAETEEGKVFFRICKSRPE